MHPILVLDREFFEEKSGIIGLIENDFSNMIDNILLKHIGSLVKFFLDLSIIYCNGGDLDHWLLCVTSNRFIKFCPAKANFVLNTPLLSSLTLITCNGVHLLTISALRIKFLTIDDNHDIHTFFLKKFPNVRELSFCEESYYEEVRFITWSLLLYLCSNLTRLVLINSCIQVFNSSRERKIGEVTYYLKDPNCVDQQFEKLEFVELREFEGTVFELIFLKQILAYSPSLSRMIVEPSDDLDATEVLDLYEELMMSLKASLRVKVIVAPHGQDA
ncbi:hypothetical protein H5410_026786 [Solanum commersonii]|uniref:FBD domain-containing protein n=1 Tax=Solanum commersonii TaxID=4109 RepID=A0A9J5Z2I7_SOLCO|nr:hypothetical protein H5410_026786 [Solanum commersonii]